MNSDDPRDGITSYVVHPDKLTGYLLNLHHIRGGSKASFFVTRGFTAGRPGDLEHALREQALGGTVADVRRDEFGLFLKIDGGAMTPQNQVMHLRTVWVVRDPIGEIAELVTAFPRRP